MKNKDLRLLPDNIYRIYNHANGNEDIFKTTENFLFFLNKHEQFIKPIANTIAYCLMPNHFHLLIKVKNEDALKEANILFQKRKKICPENYKQLKDDGYSKFVSKVFSNFFSSYTQSFNKKTGRKGSLFIPNFKRKQVGDEQYLMNLITYIHNNPIKHNFVKHLDEWDYSSYHTYVSFMDKYNILNWFGGVEGFKDFHKNIKEDFDPVLF